MSMNQQFIIDRSGVAAVNLSEGEGVVLAADGTVNYPSASTERITGIVLRKAEADEQVQILLLGTAPVKIATAGTLALGDFISAGTTGGFSAGVTGDPYEAKLLEAPAADGDLVEAYVDFTIDTDVPA